MSHNVSAIDYGASGSSELTSGTIYTSSNSYVMTASYSGLTYLGDPTPRIVTSVNICTSTPIPANSIALINFYSFQNDKFYQFSSSRGTAAYTVLSNSFAEYGKSTISFYFSQSSGSCFYLYPNSFYVGAGFRLDIGAISWVRLEDQPTTGLLQQIESNIANRLNTLHTDLEDLKKLIGGMDTSGMIQQQEETNEKLDELNDSIKNQQDKEQQAEDNISNQTTSDMSDSENAATSSLIGVISGFISALQNTGASSCSLNLPLPDFLGGSTSVNLCNLPSQALNVINIGSSIALVMFYIPLAFVMLNMIYSEIRSFTDG